MGRPPSSNASDSTAPSSGSAARSVTPLARPFVTKPEHFEARTHCPECGKPLQPCNCAVCRSPEVKPTELKGDATLLAKGLNASIHSPTAYSFPRETTKRLDRVDWYSNARRPKSAPNARSGGVEALESPTRRKSSRGPRPAAAKAPAPLDKCPRGGMVRCRNLNCRQRVEGLRERRVNYSQEVMHALNTRGGPVWQRMEELRATQEKWQQRMEKLRATQDGAATNS